MTEKICKHCGKPLVRKRYDCGSMESTTHFKKRVFCDAKCRGAWTRQENDRKSNIVKVCAVCNTQFFRRPDESLFNFKRRLACSDDCFKALISMRWQERNARQQPSQHCGSDTPTHEMPKPTPSPTAHIVDDPWEAGRVPNSIMFNPFL